MTLRSALSSVGLLGCLVVAGPALGQELPGRYGLKGSDPGTGATYSGTVTVEKTGDVTYSVVWQIGETRYVGTGIGSLQGLAVAYRSGNNTGIAIYSGAEPGTVKGFWTYAGGRAVGQETWTKR